MPEQRAGILYGLAAYLLWGFLTVYWKALSGLPAFELIGQRILWSLVVLGLVIAVTRMPAGLGRLRHDPGLVGRVVLAAVLLAANWTTYVWCVTRGEVVETALGYFIAPLFTVLAGVMLFGERLRRAQGVALGLAGLAVTVLAVGYGRMPVFALILGTTWAGYGSLKKTVPLGPVPSLTAETLVLAPVAVLLVAAHEVAGDGLVTRASTAQLVLVALSGAVTAVPLLLFAAAAPRVPLTTLGPLQYTVPTINFLLGWAVYHEAVPGWRLVGFVLVWVALAVFTLDGVRRVRSARLAPAAPVEPAVT